MNDESLVAALERRTLEEMAADKPLADRLRAVADEVRARSPMFADAVEAFVARLQAAEAGAAAPKVGEPLPGFLLPEQNGRLLGLPQVLARGPAIVTFLRGHWCPYCRLTAAALGALNAQAAAAGGSIVAITPESRAYVKMLESESGGGFPILTDMDNGYALSLNLAIWVEESMAALIKSAGWDVARYNGDPSWTLPIPAAFVVDRDGVVRDRHINPDYRERANYEAMAEALAALD